MSDRWNTAPDRFYNVLHKIEWAWLRHIIVSAESFDNFEISWKEFPYLSSTMKKEILKEYQLNLEESKMFVEALQEADIDYGLFSGASFKLFMQAVQNALLEDKC